ncbi:hypothetical protein ACFQ4O_16770 [Methylopila musalis]|uniref:Uncharacterized protein n=1 Tax=Methylopila musalis TaxID=1134781 RepID=A0ABW3ZBR7_9HYPH
MSLRAAIVSLALIGSAASAGAVELNAGSASRIEVGDRKGVAYYTVEPAGYRVVAGLARRAGVPPLRIETTLAGDQRVLALSPQGVGEPLAALEIVRQGDKVFVRPLGAGL